MESEKCVTGLDLGHMEGGGQPLCGFWPEWRKFSVGYFSEFLVAKHLCRNVDSVFVPVGQTVDAQLCHCQKAQCTGFSYWNGFILPSFGMVMLDSSSVKTVTLFQVNNKILSFVTCDDL